MADAAGLARDKRTAVPFFGQGEFPLELASRVIVEACYPITWRRNEIVGIHMEV
jgi:hypothetical protein